jgi:hypothetical protein
MRWHRQMTATRTGKAETMHCHAERQHQAAFGVARVRTAGAYTTPKSGSWSILPIAGMNNDPKTPRPRRLPVITP